MDIARLRTWHWMLIGLLVGAGVGYVQTTIGPNVDRGVTKTIYQREFETGLLDKHPLDNKPRVREVVVHPPIDGTTWVTGWITAGSRGAIRRITAAAAANPNEPVYIELQRYRYAAEFPYKPVSFANDLKLDENSTIRDYLDQLAAKYKDSGLTYKYAWWEAPKAVMGVWTAGGFIVIGVIWPAIVHVLVGAGFARKTKDEYDLDRFKGEPAAEPAPVASPVETRAALDDLNASMEEKLAGFAISNETEDAETRAENEEAEARIRALPTAPLETAAADEKPEDKEYAGEFYPVAKPGQHQDPKG